MNASPLAGSKGDSEAAQSILAKIDWVVNHSVSQSAGGGDPHREIRVKSTMKPFGIDYRIKTLRKAIDNDKRVSFDYDSISSGQSSRLVDPYYLVFRGRAYYLLGHCNKHKALRLFRLDRMGNPAITGEHFKRDHSVTPAMFFEHSWDLFGGEPIAVELRLRGKAARLVMSGKHHASEKITELEDGEVLYEITVAGVDEIALWVVGFGADATVISPPDLVAKVKEIAAGALANCG